MRTTPLSLLPGRLAATAMCAALALGIGACGDDSSGSGGDDASPLTEDQASAALLSEENLGDSYVVAATDDEEDEDSDMGCLSAFEDIETVEAPVKEEREFEADNEFGLPAVSSGVSSFDSVPDASERFETALDALEDCTNVDVTDDGTTIALEVSVDSEKSASQAQEQFNLVATGSISAEGLDFPFGLWASAVRIDNHVTFTAYTDVETEGGAAAIDAYTSAAVDRLAAVIEDETPNEDLVEAAAP